MARKWSDIREKMSREARTWEDHKTEVILVMTALRELPRAHGFTQDEPARSSVTLRGISPGCSGGRICA